MIAVTEIPKSKLSTIQTLLCDIDDTITTNGRLTAETYACLENLNGSGIAVVPVTGRCAGWCDHIARMWPVSGVVGENGAFYMRYNHETKKMHRHDVLSETTIAHNNERLKLIRDQILSTVKGTGVASDQNYRLADLAIDIAEDVPPLPQESVKQVARIARDLGATARISSIHVNCWFGDYSKVSTSLQFLERELLISTETARKNVMFIGDSPNDASMFDFFENSVGVANVSDFDGVSFEKPKFITRAHSGSGFAELCGILLNRTCQKTSQNVSSEPCDLSKNGAPES